MSPASILFLTLLAALFGKLCLRINREENAHPATRVVGDLFGAGALIITIIVSLEILERIYHGS